MAKRVTDEMAQQMLERYEIVGIFAQVAREFGVSPSTASRHIKRLQNLDEKTESKVDLTLDKRQLTDLENKIKNFSKPISSLSLVLTEHEKAELKELGVLYE